MASDELVRLFPSSEREVPERFRLGGRLEQREYLIGGELRSWSGPCQEVLSPVLERSGDELRPRVIGSYPLLGEAEARAAICAAAAAYDNGRGRWPTMPVAERIRHVEEFAFRLAERREEVVKLLVWEICKPVKEAEKEFDRTVAYVRDTVDALKELDRISSRFTVQQGIIGQIRRAPLGTVLCMGPFNYPLNETFTTLVPALVTGNSVVFKPPKHGVLLHRPLLEAFRDSFPPGVVNTVYGSGQTVVPPMMTGGLVNVLAFIGSSKVSNVIRAQHPRPNRLRCVLGLDAKNAAIVLPDADLDLAVRECALGALSFNGQRCTALKILWVHRSVLDAFLERFVAAVGKLRPGMPWDEAAGITPLPEAGKTDWLAGLVEDALASGARLVNPGGGERAGTLFRPAVLCPVGEKARLWHQEQFGPVVPAVPYEDLAEPVRWVEESDFGQQVSVFGGDPGRIAALIDPLVNQVCRVNLNSQCQRGPDSFPFTGRKDSAEGTLSVSDALRVFTIRTLVAAKDEPVNRELVTRIVRERRSAFLSTDFIL